MSLKKEKIGLLASVAWLLLAVPISEDLYDEALDAGLFMRAFALAIVGLPVWLVFGWRWLTDNAPIRAKFWVSIAIIGLILAFLMEDRFFGWDWQDVSYIPLVSVVPFLFLVWVFERGAMLFWRKKSVQKEFSANLMPTKAELERDVGKLLQAVESIAAGIFHEFERLSSRIKLPAIINSRADATIAAYALIHLHFRRRGFPDGSKAVMTFAVFRSQMLTNYLLVSEPELPGLPSMTPEDLKDEALRASGDEMLKLYEEFGVIVHGNLDRNAAYPFFPIYENARPYLGPQATVPELNQAFDSLFASLSGQAQRSVENILKRGPTARSK